MTRVKIKGLYAITPDVENTANLLKKVEQALIGGVHCIQYRNKSANEDLLKEQAQLLMQLCRKYRVPLIINDHLHLAIAIDADGLHVGQQDMPIAEARKWLGKHKIIGASCYNSLDLALQAEKDGSDYVAFGAFFPSSTKPDAVPVSIDLLTQAREQIKLPIVAIGGIKLSNAEQVIQSGCTAIAVCNDLFHNENTTITTRQFTQLFSSLN